MSSSNLIPPTLVMNSSGTRQQVPLRDYLNARIAPFLKKAMTESLASEAEFPLQWLGECLIHQSMLYEGNPDTTNIRERFRYQFDVPAAPTQEQPEPSPSAPTNGVDEPEQAPPTDPAAEAAASVPVPPPDSSMADGQPSSTTETKVEETAEAQAEQPATAAPQDVDMAGTT